MSKREHRIGSISCPACGHLMAPRQIHVHTSSCILWASQVGDPLPYFKWDKHSKRHLFADGCAEGRDYVQCKICLLYGWDFRFIRMADHLAVHGCTEEEYTAKFPGAPIRLASTYQKRARTVQERFGVDNVFQADEIKRKSKETALEKYGVDHPALAPDARKRRRATNMTKYGHENPLGGKGGIERARKGMLKKYGIGNPQQVLGIRLKTQATNLEKYGAEHYFQTPEFKEHFREMCLEKYGVPFPPQRLWKNQPHPSPNKLEQDVGKMSPECVIFSGDWVYWVKNGGKSRNPDFLLLRKEQMEAHRKGTPLSDLRATAIMEILGDHWHSPKMTGKSRDAHKRQIERFYEELGIACLVLWEKEIRKNPGRVAERIQKFVSRWQHGGFRKIQVDSILDYLWDTSDSGPKS